MTSKMSCVFLAKLNCPDFDKAQCQHRNKESNPERE